MPTQSRPSHHQRVDAIDALRGLALVWMTLYHLAFDLNHFGFIREDFYRDPLWTLQRTAILSLFLFSAGMAQALVMRRGQRSTQFLRRWLQIAGCALLVSAGSWLMYPGSFIYFGVLHGIAVMLLVVRVTTSWGLWLWPLGLLAIVAPPLGAAVLASGGWSEMFNGPSLNWLGLVTRKPVTKDYVPLLPWLGVMWWGAASGHMWLRDTNALASWHAGPGLRPLLLLGQWSLLYYMLHQPLLIGMVSLARSLHG